MTPEQAAKVETQAKQVDAASHVMVQGVYCGEQPYKVLAMCTLAICLCCLGLLRFRVQTDPQHLWVGANSLAAQEKAQYEVRRAVPAAIVQSNSSPLLCFPALLAALLQTM